MKSQFTASSARNATAMQQLVASPCRGFTLLPSRRVQVARAGVPPLRSLSVHHMDSLSLEGLHLLVSAGWKRHADSWNQHIASGQDSQGASIQLAGKLTGPVQYLYDGDCSMCQGLVALLQRHDRGGQIEYVNVQDASYSAEAHAHIEQHEALETIHVIAADGSVLLGPAALRSLFDIAGLGWAAQLSEMPLVAKLVDLSYDFLSSHRISLGHAFDALAASKKMNLSKAGVESCHDVEACEVEW